MKIRTTAPIALAAAVALMLGSACTKGSTLGGSKAEPAAVETAGVPEFSAGHGEDAAEGEHDNIAAPAEQDHAGVTDDHSTETLGASSAGDLEPDGGNVETTTTPTTTHP